MRPRARVSTSRSKQRGQALLLVTVTALAMILALLVMFNMGQVTTEKMRLQNTADAAAYSSALAQARDYNFSAYLNRGMIANDAAVAQLVGLASWGRNYHDTFNRLTTDVDRNTAGSILFGPLYPLWTATHSVAQGASRALKPAFENAARGFIPLLLNINTVIVQAQKIYHYGTALTVAQTLGVFNSFFSVMERISGFETPNGVSNYLSADSSNVITQNDPAAQLSALGLLSYLYNTQQWAGFTKTRNPLGPHGSETDDNSYSKRYCAEAWGGIFGGDWPCSSPLGPSYSRTTIIKIDTVTYPADDGTFDGPHKDRMAGVVMASTDDFTRDRSQNWWLPILIDPVLIVGPNAYVPSAWFLKMLFHDGSTAFATNKTPVNALTGGQKKTRDDSWHHRWVANDSTNMLGIATASTFIPFYGFINLPVIPLWSNESGTAPLGRNAAGTAGTGWSSGEWANGASQTALRAYRDVENIQQASAGNNENFTSPALVVEVEKPITSIAISSSKGGVVTGNLGIGRAGTVADPTGCGGSARDVQAITILFAQNNLDLGQTTNKNCMRALAKAEAYFSRPAGLFPRDDGKQEYGSLYSPYWQARLVPNTAIEQIGSILAQIVF